MFVSPFSSQVESEHGLLDENVHVVEVEPVSKTRLLETAVEKAKEAIDIYEVQLNRSEDHIACLQNKHLKAFGLLV